MKNLQNLGKALNKAEQKTINGGKLQCFDITKEYCLNYGRAFAEGGYQPESP